MSQPNTTSQKPKPDSTAEKNLSRCMYLPRRMPSTSQTATLTLVVSEARISSRTEACSCNGREVSFIARSGVGARFDCGTAGKIPAIPPRLSSPGFALEHLGHAAGRDAAHEAEAGRLEQRTVFALRVLASAVHDHHLQVGSRDELRVDAGPDALGQDALDQQQPRARRHRAPAVAEQGSGACVVPVVDHAGEEVGIGAAGYALERVALQHGAARCEWRCRDAPLRLLRDM